MWFYVDNCGLLMLEFYDNNEFIVEVKLYMYSVILVEDEGLVREAIARNIKWKDLGFELLSTCKNGLEAKDFLVKNKVDLVITDICMPFMDGMELSKFVYETRPDTKIIICSGFDEFGYAQQALKYKVEEYVLKPVTSAEFSKLLTNTKDKISKKRDEDLKQNKITRTYFENKDFIKSKILSKLMMGTKEMKDILKEMKDAGISIESEFYKVAAIELDDYTDIYKLSEEKKRQIDLMIFSITNIAEEIINEHNIGEVFCGNGNQIYIIFKTSLNTITDERIKSICEKIQFESKKLFKLDTTIGIGSKVKALDELYMSWKDALIAIEHRYTLGKGHIISIDEIKLTYRTIPEYELYIKSVLHAIQTGEKKELDIKMEEIKYIMKNSNLPKPKLTMYIQQLAARVNTFVDLSENDFKIYLRENEVISEEIEKSYNIDKTIQYLKEYFMNILENFDIHKDSSGKKIALMALEYIENHYKDYDIGLNSVCTHLCISPSHFSKIFKTNTGETFVEALTKKRMLKAKELLENTALKNYEIADKVGFNDPHYFSVSFKKATGMTPKEYAKERR